ARHERDRGHPTHRPQRRREPGLDPDHLRSGRVRLRSTANGRERLPAQGRHRGPARRGGARRRRRRGDARADRDPPPARALRPRPPRRRGPNAALAPVVDRARARDPDPPRERLLKCRARRATLSQRADDQAPPLEHLPQARRPRPRPGRDRGLRRRPGRARDPSGPTERLAHRAHTNVAARRETRHVRTRAGSDLRRMCAASGAPTLGASSERSVMKRKHTYRSLGVAAALLIAVGMSVVFSAAAAGHRPSPTSRAWSNEAGIQHLHFQTAPIRVLPGQNSVQLASIPQNEKPAVDGYIVRMRPDLQYLDGKVPPVNVIHLHDGVWINGKHGPLFGGGEEKTVFHIPPGDGYPYKTSDRWSLDEMIHNQLPAPTRVRLVWDLDFIPASTPLARTVKPVFPLWLDVRGGEGYPVFNIKSGSGKDGTFTYPTDDKNAYAGQAPLNEVRMPVGGTIVSAIGHVPPGGLYDPLELVRPGATLPSGRACRREARNIGDTRSATTCVAATPGSTAHSVRIFRAQAHYYEPAG